MPSFYLLDHSRISFLLYPLLDPWRHTYSSFEWLLLLSMAPDSRLVHSAQLEQGWEGRGGAYSPRPLSCSISKVCDFSTSSYKKFHVVNVTHFAHLYSDFLDTIRKPHKPHWLLTQRRPWTGSHTPQVFLKFYLPTCEHLSLELCFLRLSGHDGKKCMGVKFV